MSHCLAAMRATAVVCSLIFLVIGVMIGALCGHWTTLYRLGKQEQPGSTNNSEPTQPAAPVPVYEELASHEGKHIQLKENVAYGPL